MFYNEWTQRTASCAANHCFPGAHLGPDVVSEHSCLLCSQWTLFTCASKAAGLGLYLGAGPHSGELEQNPNVDEV